MITTPDPSDASEAPWASDPETGGAEGGTSPPPGLPQPSRVTCLDRGLPINLTLSVLTPSSLRSEVRRDLLSSASTGRCLSAASDSSLSKWAPSSARQQARAAEAGSKPRAGGVRTRVQRWKSVRSRAMWPSSARSVGTDWCMRNVAGGEGGREGGKKFLGTGKFLVALQQ